MRISILAACAALLIAGSAARADDRKDIEALYARLRGFIMANNPDGILPLETADFKAKGHDGKVVNGKALAMQMKQDGAMMKIKTFNIKLTKVAVKGNKADVETSFSSMGEMADPSGKGKKHTMGMNGVIANKLAKTPGGWKFSYMEEKGGSMTMDGKPFNPNMMPSPPPKKGK